MLHSPDLYSSYSLPLVILSFVIAACAAFCALELVDRIGHADARTRGLWLWAGAATFGLGTWAMHFVGMLAFELEVPVGYHLPTVLLSMLPVMAAAAFALSLAARPDATKAHLFWGAVLLGVGIGGMHYSGMLAMRMEARTYYDPKFLLISVAFAVAASLFALYSTFAARDGLRHGGERFLSAAVMGGAITGLHYTAMINASHFAPTDGTLPAGTIPSPLTTAAPAGSLVVQLQPVSAVVIAIVILGVIATVLRQARRADVARHADQQAGVTVLGTTGDSRAAATTDAPRPRGRGRIAPPPPRRSAGGGGTYGLAEQYGNTVQYAHGRRGGGAFPARLLAGLPGTR